MNRRYSEIIHSLRLKIDKIIDLNENERKKNEFLMMEIEKLKDAIRIKTEELEDIQTKYDNLRFANAITVDADTSHDAKIKINRIVREIDKCIALLNND